MDDLLPWFTLKSVPGVGNLLFKRLVDRFKTPTKVLSADTEDLLQVDGMQPRTAQAIQRHRTPDQIKKEAALVQSKRYRIVTLTDPDYPFLLAHIPDPPPYLYVYGRIDAIRQPVAVVGSRNATTYGLAMTERLCRDLAVRGLTIVSGMARGIDTAAHMGALMGRGQTVAVLGSGLEKIYPAENRKLFHRIADNGAVISEFALLAEPDPHHFPQRNRIISGMTWGTVVVEATRRSGSLITARLAAEQNREVFAVPGSITSFKSSGTHTLIKQGAKLVEHAQDILDEMPVDSSSRARLETGPAIDRNAPGPKLSGDETKVVAVLEPYPLHIDRLMRRLPMNSGRLAGLLLQLELKGLVVQSPGKLFALTAGGESEKVKKPEETL
jgi:DNA processing protein